MRKIENPTLQYRLYVLLGLLVVFSSASVNAADTWNISTFHAGDGEYGDNPWVACSPDGSLWITHSGGNRNLWLTQIQDQRTNTWKLDADGNCGEGLASSLAIDLEGIPHVAYCKDGGSEYIVKYATLSENNLSLEEIARSDSIQGTPSIAVDSDDNKVHVFFCDYARKRVRSFIRSRGTWSEANSRDKNVRPELLMQTGSNKQAFFSSGGMWHSELIGSKWIDTLIDADGSYSRAHGCADSMASGAPCVAYVYLSGQDGVCFAWREGATWRKQKLSDDSLWYGGISMARCGSRFIIAYRNWSNIKLILGTPAEGWTTQSISSTYGVGNLALTCDRSGDPVIAYEIFDGARGGGLGIIRSESNKRPMLEWSSTTGYDGRQGVYPDAVQNGVRVTYKVVYKDVDNDAPQVGFPRVRVYKRSDGSQVSGSPFTMTGQSGSYTSGRTYTRSLQLPVGHYDYKFEAKDGHGAVATGTAIYTKAGPSVFVANRAPTLQWSTATGYGRDGVSPDMIMAGGEVIYEVVYKDQDGDAPSSGYPKVHVYKNGTPMSGSPFTMNLSGGGNFSTGRGYRKKLTLPMGSYAYKFVAKDSEGAVASGSPVGQTDGPEVQEPTGMVRLIASPVRGGRVTVNNGLSSGRHNVGTLVTNRAVANTDWTFLRWSDGVERETRVDTVSAAGLSLTALFRYSAVELPDTACRLSQCSRNEYSSKILGVFYPVDNALLYEVYRADSKGGKFYHVNVNISDYADNAMKFEHTGLPAGDMGWYKIRAVVDYTVREFSSVRMGSTKPGITEVEAPVVHTRTTGEGNGLFAGTADVRIVGFLDDAMTYFQLNDGPVKTYRTTGDWLPIKANGNDNFEVGIRAWQELDGQKTAVSTQIRLGGFYGAPRDFIHIQSSNVKISGVVKDSEGAPLKGVKCDLVGHGIHQSARTDSKGTFVVTVPRNSELRLVIGETEQYLRTSRYLGVVEVTRDVGTLVRREAPEFRTKVPIVKAKSFLPEPIVRFGWKLDDPSSLVTELRLRVYRDGVLNNNILLSDSDRKAGFFERQTDFRQGRYDIELIASYREGPATRKIVNKDSFKVVDLSALDRITLKANYRHPDAPHLTVYGKKNPIYDFWDPKSASRNYLLLEHFDSQFDTEALWDDYAGAPEGVGVSLRSVNKANGILYFDLAETESGKTFIDANARVSLSKATLGMNVEEVVHEHSVLGVKTSISAYGATASFEWDDKDDLMNFDHPEWSEELGTTDAIRYGGWGGTKEGENISLELMTDGLENMLNRSETFSIGLEFDCQDLAVFYNPENVVLTLDVERFESRALRSAGTALRGSTAEYIQAVEDYALGMKTEAGVLTAAASGAVNPGSLAVRSCERSVTSIADGEWLVSVDFFVTNNALLRAGLLVEQVSGDVAVINESSSAAYRMDVVSSYLNQTEFSSNSAPYHSMTPSSGTYVFHLANMETGPHRIRYRVRALAGRQPLKAECVGQFFYLDGTNHTGNLMVEGAGILYTDLDSDGDQLPDGWELDMAESLSVLSRTGNFDGDALSDYNEWVRGLDPLDADSDDDGVEDGDIPLPPPPAPPPMPQPTATPEPTRGAGATDIAVYARDDGTWLIRKSSDGSMWDVKWGWAGADAMPADYDGDGVTDMAVYAPADGAWVIRESSNPGTALVHNWGWNGADPIPGDYDGDGTTDIAVYARDDGTWLIRKSSDGSMWDVKWGWAGANAMQADYDGDGITDMAVYAPADGAWVIRESSNPGTARVLNWGWNGADPIPGDYDGDGTTDIAVYARDDGTWLISKSSDSQMWDVKWGWSGANAMPADYDGDGITDMAVYAPADGAWVIRESSNPGTARVLNWGWNGADPVPGDYDGQ